MEDKEDENKKENDNENNDKTNNEIQSYQQKIKELTNKINVLIKGVKEEREKTKKLTNEIEVLKLDKIVKEETISKLKNENESLNSFISKDDPKSYFENITKINNDINFNPEEYDLMKKENVKLKEENKTLTEQNSELKNKIEQLIEERKVAEQKYKEEIYKYKQERVEQSNELYDKSSKIELLNKLYKEIENKKNEKENEIIKYKEEEKNNSQKIKDLENQLKSLERKYKTCNFELNTIKQQFNERITIDIDDYIFKGLIMEDDFNEKELYNKEIKIRFSSKDIFIKLNFDNKNLKIDAKNIKFTFYEKTKDKVIIFYEIKEKENIIKEEEEEDEKNQKVKIIMDKTITNAMLCKFTEKECNYIFEFKKEMMNKYKENKKILENKESIFNGYFLNFFND